jgi:ribosomal protein L34E
LSAPTRLRYKAVGSIDSRLARLEARGHRCPECGLAPNGPRPIAVIHEERPEESFEGDPHEACTICGQPLHTVIRVFYGDEGGGGLRWP